jgi:phosphoketolase
MALTSRATHVLQWPVQKVAIPQGGANPQNRSQFGLESATRLHEVGIASNRESAGRGEYVPGPCTHRPSSHGSWEYPKSLC